MIGYEENAPTVSWQLDRLRGELKDGDLIIVGEDRRGRALDEFDRVSSRCDGRDQLRCQSAPSSVVSFITSLDPAIWAVQAPCGEWNCPSPRDR